MIMARMHSRKRGKAGSKKPMKKVLPLWVRYKAKELELLIVKLAKETNLYTGADIENLCREAGILALRENLKSREVTMKHFEGALKKTRSSVTEQDLEAYKILEERFFRSARGAAIRKEVPTYFG